MPPCVALACLSSRHSDSSPQHRPCSPLLLRGLFEPITLLPTFIDPPLRNPRAHRRLLLLGGRVSLGGLFCSLGLSSRLPGNCPPLFGLVDCDSTTAAVIHCQTQAGHHVRNADKHRHLRHHRETRAEVEKRSIRSSYHYVDRQDCCLTSDRRRTSVGTGER